MRFIAAAATCLVVIQAGAQVPLPLPAEIDSTGPEHGAAADNPTGSDNARKAAAEERVEAVYGAAMKKCDDLQGTKKSVCAEQAEAERVKGKVDIALPLPATPKRQPSTRSAK